MPFDTSAAEDLNQPGSELSPRGLHVRVKCRIQLRLPLTVRGLKNNLQIERIDVSQQVSKMKPLKLLLVLFLPLVGLTAALIVTPATDAAGQSTGLHTEFDDTDIEILAELVAALAKAHQQASLRASHQIEGGEAANVARALYNLSVAKARLAHAKGDLDGHLRHQHAAVVAAKDCAERTAIAYEIAQSVPLDLVIEAQIAYAKARLKLNDIKRSIANVTAVQEE